MSLIVTPWPQFHILDCVSQSPSVPLKHLQAWFSFLSLYAASCPHTFSCQPFLLFCSALQGQTPLLGLQVGLQHFLPPSLQPLGEWISWQNFPWETESAQSSSVTVLLHTSTTWCDCKLTTECEITTIPVYPNLKVNEGDSDPEIPYNEDIQKHFRDLFLKMSVCSCLLFIQCRFPPPSQGIC